MALANIRQGVRLARVIQGAVEQATNGTGANVRLRFPRAQRASSVAPAEEVWQ